MAAGDVAQRLSRSRSQIENRLGVDLARGLGDDLLQLVVVGYLGSHHGEIGVGIEVELLGHAHPPTDIRPSGR